MSFIMNLKNFFTTNYNLGRAKPPRPLPIEYPDYSRIIKILDQKPEGAKFSVKEFKLLINQ